MNHPSVSVRVEGEFALFTRPEYKFERVSYPLPTPSAARGILEAIYWHPQFKWRGCEIRVYRRGHTFSLLRNEVNSKMSPASEFIYADHDRAQRHSVVLRDVEYAIEAEVIPLSGSDPAEKHREIFRRRLERGQCHHRPVLGTREFAADFRVDEGGELEAWEEDLGLMLWDLDFRSDQPASPLFFDATISEGRMHVPPAPSRRHA